MKVRVSKQQTVALPVSVDFCLIIGKYLSPHSVSSIFLLDVAFIGRHTVQLLRWYWSSQNSNTSPLIWSLRNCWCFFLCVFPFVVCFILSVLKM